MITENKIDKIQREIRLAVAKIERENNVKISFGAQRYTQTEYGTRMTVKTTEKSKATVKAKSSENLTISRMYGFQKNIVGKSFMSNGKTFVITEFKTRNRKYPIIASNGGRSYKFTVQSIKSKNL